MPTLDGANCIEVLEVVQDASIVIEVLEYDAAVVDVIEPHVEVIEVFSGPAGPPGAGLPLYSTEAELQGAPFGWVVADIAATPDWPTLGGRVSDGRYPVRVTGELFSGWGSKDLEIFVNAADTMLWQGVIDTQDGPFVWRPPTFESRPLTDPGDASQAFKYLLMRDPYGAGDKWAKSYNSLTSFPEEGPGDDTSFPRYTPEGTLAASDPYDGRDVANKRYVDGAIAAIPPAESGLKEYTSVADLDLVREPEIGILRVADLAAEFPALAARWTTSFPPGPAELIVTTTQAPVNASGVVNFIQEFTAHHNVAPNFRRFYRSMQRYGPDYAGGWNGPPFNWKYTPQLPDFSSYGSRVPVSLTDGEMTSKFVGVPKNPDSLVLRDDAGRSQIADPAAADDIANKRYVDASIGAIPAPGLPRYEGRAAIDALRVAEVGILHVDNITAAFPELASAGQAWNRTHAADFVVRTELTAQGTGYANIVQTIENIDVNNKIPAHAVCVRAWDEATGQVYTANYVLLPSMPGVNIASMVPLSNGTKNTFTPMDAVATVGLGAYGQRSTIVRRRTSDTFEAGNPVTALDVVNLQTLQAALATAGGLKVYADMAAVLAVRTAEVGTLHVPDFAAAFPGRPAAYAGPADLVITTSVTPEAGGGKLVAQTFSYQDDYWPNIIEMQRLIQVTAANEEIYDSSWADIGALPNAAWASAGSITRVSNSTPRRWVSESPTSTPTASKVMVRDAAGRAQVVAPAAPADIATKQYVDDAIAAAVAAALAALP